jgi:hypothetical protein
MNPPDVRLDPRTQARQRDELIAIVDHESARLSSHRRMTVPLLAAAAVVAVVAGLAIGVPALRGAKTQPQVAGADTSTSTLKTEPLSAADKTAYAAQCHGISSRAPGWTYTVIDDFRWVNPPADAWSTAWVVVRGTKGIGKITTACGFTKGKWTDMIHSAGIQLKAAEGSRIGNYTKAVARITVTPKGGRTVDAVLSNGFFFTPFNRVDTYDPNKPNAAPDFTMRAYDAAGKLLYATPKTVREQQAEIDQCFTDPAGKRLVHTSQGGAPNPTVKTCPRGIYWGW